MATTPTTNPSSSDGDVHLKPAKPPDTETPLVAFQSPEKLPAPDTDLTGLEDCGTISQDEDAVDKVYNILFKAFSGKWPQEEENWKITFKLGGQDSFDRLLDRTRQFPPLQAFFECKIRYNWDGETLTLLLMAAPLHDAFKEDFAQLLQRRLDELATTTPSLAPFRAKLRSRGHTFVRDRARHPTFNRSPDGQLKYDDSVDPAFVYEICWSHGNLKQAALEYFEKKQGSVCKYTMRRWRALGACCGPLLLTYRWIRHSPWLRDRLQTATRT
jgi:hypothetical protein